MNSRHGDFGTQGLMLIIRPHRMAWLEGQVCTKLSGEFTFSKYIYSVVSSLLKSEMERVFVVGVRSRRDAWVSMEVR